MKKLLLMLLLVWTAAAFAQQTASPSLHRQHRSTGGGAEAEDN